jgi:hypothetical protein
MRPLAAALLLILLSQREVGAQVTSAGLVCPPADSLVPASDQSRRQPNARKSRYVVYVIDSQFVILSAPRDPQTGRPNDFALFAGLQATDIASISELKENAAAHWKVCPGVPVLLILTQSKRWRPPAKAGP